MAAASRCKALLRLCLITMLYQTTTATSRDAVGFSVDVYYNKTRIRLNAYPGINLTALAEKYFEDSGHPRDDKVLEEIVDKLEARGGGDCDACKTMVEVLSSKLHELVASQVTAKTESRVEVTGNTEKVVRSSFAGPDVIRRARSVCRASEYHQFSKYHRKWCERAMDSKQAEDILRRFAGKMVPSAVYERKDMVCTRLLGVCPHKRFDSSTADSCRLCAEVMQDLSFLMRRSRPDIKRSEMIGTNPTTRKKMPDGSGFMQRSHVLTHLDSLCEEMHLRQPWRLSENLREECEDMVSEHTDTIVASFRAMYKGGHGLMFPARDVCVNTGLCKAKKFDSFMTDLQNFHFQTNQTKRDKSTKTEL